MKDTARFALERLVSEAPFFDSRDLFLRSMGRARRIVRDAESRRADKAADLSRALAALPAESFAFALRSVPLRVMFERLASASQNDGAARSAARDVEREDPYSLLRDTFVKIGSVRTPREDFQAWSAIGFDMTSTVSGPFPYVVSYYSGRDDVQESRNAGWSESNEFRELYDEELAANCGITRCHLVPLGAEDVSLLQEAMSLLGAIHPRLQEDVALNVRYVAYFDTIEPYPNSLVPPTLKNLSTNVLPGACFLSPLSTRRLPNLVEALYHEALHMKYTNMVKTVPVYRRGYTGESGASFPCPWALGAGSVPTPTPWHFERTVCAFHVYVHLLVVYSLMRERPLPARYRGRVPEEWIGERRSVALAKGAVLLEWLEGEYAKVMTEVGQQFFNALRETFTALAYPM